MKLEVSEEIREKVAKAFAIVEHFEIDEQSIGSTLDLVGDVLRSNRLIYLGEPEVTTWGFNEHQDIEPHICFEFRIARGALQVGALRSELSAKIAESELGHFPAGIVVRIIPAEHGNTFALAA